MQSDNNQRVKKYYVYAHYIKDTNKIFYIGVGTILNLKTNKEKSKYSRAFAVKNRNNFWKNIYNKYGRDVKILHHFETKQESLDKEKELINKLGRRWLKEGLLTNISSGGEIGPINRKFIMSEEQKKKLSILKSISLYIYSREGKFLTEIKTIKAAASYCGVTYNSICSCLKTKNYTNGYFVFKENKGKKLNYTYKDINQTPYRGRKVYSKCNITNKIVEHSSIRACANYLDRHEKSVRYALKNNTKCNKHLIFEVKISSQDSKEEIL